VSAELARPRPVPGQTRNRRLPLLIGLVLAAVAFLGVFAIGSLNNKSAPVTTTTVLVAARNIQAREVMSPDMVVPAQIPTTAVPPGAVSQFATIKQEITLVSILKGQPLTTNLVSASPDSAIGGQTAYLPIPAGFVARAIPGGEENGVAGYIAAGDYINVMATVSTSLFGDGSGKQVTKLVFTELHVIRIGPATPGKQGQVQGVSSSLTVIMSACDAEMMDWLLANAKLSYVLLSYHDYQSAPVGPDPTCPNVTPTSGIGPKQVNARYGFTSI
jgi:pilus assembly protein CpaB